MNFKFKLSRRLARMKAGVAMAGMLALGCGIGSSGPVVDRIEAIAIQPARLALQPSQTANLDVVITTSRGNLADLSSLQWSTTGGVIGNNGLSGGVLHILYTAPRDSGTYAIVITTTYGAPTATASISVTVTPVPVNAIALTPSNVGLAVNDTTRLRATLTDSTGAVIVGRAITWNSSDAGVATVLESGFVRAMGAGTTTITATCEGHTTTATITVTQ